MYLLFESEQKSPFFFSPPPIMQTYLLSFLMHLCSVLDFLHASFDKVKFCICLFFHQNPVQSLLSKQIFVVWAGLKMRRGKKGILHFDFKKKGCPMLKCSTAGRTFFFCALQSLKKGLREQGT